MSASKAKRSMADLFRKQREHDSGAFIPIKTQHLAGIKCDCGQCDGCRMRSFVSRIQSIDPEKCPNGYLTGGGL